MSAASLRALLGDLSGAFADLGTFLSLVVAVLALRGFDASSILFGFGIFALATAAFYRLPIPVQPMKVVAAMIIVGALTPGQTAAVGILISLLLLVLVGSGLIGWIERLLPASVVLGVQLAVGVELAWLGLGQVIDAPAWGGAALALLAAGYLTRYRHLAGLLVIAGAIAVALFKLPAGTAFPSPGFYPPTLRWPDWSDFDQLALLVLLPQIALTLSNAVFATATLAAEYFPPARARAGAPRLAFGTGLFNLLLAPLGALPMCHGSGGLVAQYGFGARSWRAPAIFGAACLALGLGFGGGAQQWLLLVPLAAVGALLVFTGIELAISRRLLEMGRDNRVVAVGTALACVLAGMAIGLVVGFVLERLLRVYLRRRANKPDPP